MLRILSLQVAALALISLSACAHDDGRPSAEATARQACQERNTSPVEMDSCIEQMRNAIEHANIPPPPPPSQAHPSQAPR
jgi:hypothetical protein